MVTYIYIQQKCIVPNVDVGVILMFGVVNAKKLAFSTLDATI